MHDENREAFSLLLVDLAAMFDTEVSETRLGMYFAALRDLEFEVVEVAVERAIRYSRFFPKPAELRGYVTDPKPDSGALLASLQAAMRKYGTTPGMNPADSLPLLLNLLIERLGGWYVVMGSAWEDLQRHVEKLAPPLIEAAVARGMSLDLLDAPPAREMRLLEEAIHEPTAEERAKASALIRESIAKIKSIP